MDQQSQQTTGVVLSGYYGFDNAGDEAILQATVEGLRRLLPGSSVTVLSAAPGRTAATYDVLSADRFSPRDLLRCIRSPGVLVSGGGGLFQDSTSPYSLYYYLGILWLARLRGMPTMVYAQGLGPLRRRSSRLAVRVTLRMVDRITVRDESSLRLLESIGVPARAVVTADPAFAIEPSGSDEVAGLLRDVGVPQSDAPLLAVALRPWLDAGPDQVLIQALQNVINSTGVQLLCFALQPGADRAAASTVAASLRGHCTVLNDAYSPSQIAGLLGACSAVVAMRLHAMILASISGTPSVALSYDPKVEAAARQLGLPHFPHQTTDAAALSEAITSMVQLDPDRRAALKQRSQDLARRAEQNFVILRELVRS